MINYSYNGSQFSVLANTNDASHGTGLGRSDEGKILNELNDLSWGEESEEKDIQMTALQNKLASLVGDACFPLVREIAPLSIPEPRTLQERIYPPTYTLRVYSEDERLASQELTTFELPAKHPPIAEASLQEISLSHGIPFVIAETGVRGYDPELKMWWLKEAVDSKLRDTLPNYISCSWFEFDRSEEAESEFTIFLNDDSLLNPTRDILLH
jgi:hypothetical protein